MEHTTPEIRPNAPALHLVKGGRAGAAPALPANARARRYRERIVVYAERIRRAGGLNEIVVLLDEALRETRALQGAESAPPARRRAQEAGRQIQSLRAELELVTALLNEDPLTLALNRRGLAGGFNREAARADRHGGALALVVIDLDEFKRLNDTHGHAVGDEALRHFAAVARAALRPSDLFARLGGEEFVAVLSDTQLDDARLCALRVQAALAAAPLARETVRIALTFSAGVVERARGEPLEHCLGRADEALYAAKRAGRNRVKTAG